MAILFLIRKQALQSAEENRPSLEATTSIKTVQKFLPHAARFGKGRGQLAGKSILTSEGTPVGFALQTSPQADIITGYAGANQLLLVFDTEEKLVGIELLSSQDTPEHVELINNNTEFWNRFLGQTWQQIAKEKFTPEADAVTGATLTSLAICETIQYRIKGEQVSYRFSKPILMSELQSVFKNATQFEQLHNHPYLYRVINSQKNTLGYFTRTSSVNDHRNGYRGPTDTILFLDEKRTVLMHKIHDSYETPMYLEDVSSDWSFPYWFKGKSLKSLSEIDFDEAGIDGVSGATITSMTIADSLKETAQAIILFESKKKKASWRWTTADWITGSIIVMALLISFTSWKGNQHVRFIFQWALIIILGFTNGHLISQGLLVGWAQHGVPFRFAGGLILLVAVAFAIPFTTKTQIYCHQLCPHGAAQELLKNRLNIRLRLSKPVRIGLAMIVPALFLWVIVVAMTGWSHNLASLEAFDAYLFRAAGWATIIIAVVGLVASCFVPMAYCRFGCPTGALLKHLRFHKQSDRWSHSDSFAVACLLLAIGLQTLI